MVEVEIDGRKVEVPEGSMVMDAAARLDIYVPHFCYHKKLSIAANCRMCLVDVEKAPKPLPACATPVTAGMIVRTQSDKARQAQKGVMEFLLINHPLDCPICDQGGECQLQDLAVGYGGSSSRYREAKRVVFHKPLGPLISAEEMARCIHCTRCVRFGQEIAGIMELGMAGRGEHSEILSFVGGSVDSELSGNMIDLCPVGALTSRPFRYEARTWELSRRRSISPHDALGSNLIAQVKGQRVLRVLPYENEAINECWLSDRDRFAYEGLNAADRLTRPLVKQDGQWHEVDWSEALEYVRHALSHVRAEHGAAAVGALAGPTATLEELHLLARLVRGLGSDNIDFRLRHSDFSGDGLRKGVPWLGMEIPDVGKLDRLLLVGSFLRKDHPLLAARIRQAVKRGCRVSVVHGADDDLLMPVVGKAIAAPRDWVRVLAEIAVAIAQGKGQPSPAHGVQPSDAALHIAHTLQSGHTVGILLGNAAAQSPAAAQLQAWAEWIAHQTHGRFGFTVESAAATGGYLAGALPQAGGLNARTMLEQPRKAYLLWAAEPEFDCADPALAQRALAAADTVIACTPYRNGALEYADVILPIAPFTETAGTYVNCEGHAQSFNGAVRPLGDTRPGWKVLRVLGNLLELPGFDQESAEHVRAEVLVTDLKRRLSNDIALTPEVPAAGSGLQRVADVPIYASDMIVRRSGPLQATRDARPPRALAHPDTLAAAGLAAGDKARVLQGEAVALLDVAADPRLPLDVVRVAAGHPSTAALGAMFGAVRLERT